MRALCRTRRRAFVGLRFVAALGLAGWICGSGLGGAHGASPAKPLLFGGRNVHNADLFSTSALVRAPDPSGLNEINFFLLMKTRAGESVRYDPLLEALDGLKVRLPGYMMPFDTYIKMKQFVVIYAPPDCPFCDPPLPSEYVFVRLKEGLRSDYVQSPVKVEGRLSLCGKGHSDPMLKEFFYVIDEATVEKFGDL